VCSALQIVLHVLVLAISFSALMSQHPHDQCVGTRRGTLAQPSRCCRPPPRSPLRGCPCSGHRRSSLGLHKAQGTARRSLTHQFECEPAYIRSGFSQMAVLRVVQLPPLAQRPRDRRRDAGEVSPQRTSNDRRCGRVRSRTVCSRVWWLGRRQRAGTGAVAVDTARPRSRSVGPASS